MLSVISIEYKIAVFVGIVYFAHRSIGQSFNFVGAFGIVLCVHIRALPQQLEEGRSWGTPGSG